MITNYQIFRGKCKEACEALQSVLPELRMVRGHYYDAIWNRNEAHWWLETPSGVIVDPTKHQFPTCGTGEYVEFDGMYDCDNCGEKVEEKHLLGDGRYGFCSGKCYGHFVGVF